MISSCFPLPRRKIRDLMHCPMDVSAFHFEFLAIPSIPPNKMPDATPTPSNPSKTHTLSWSPLVQFADGFGYNSEEEAESYKGQVFSPMVRSVKDIRAITQQTVWTREWSCHSSEEGSSYCPSLDHFDDSFVESSCTNNNNHNNELIHYPKVKRIHSQENLFNRIPSTNVRGTGFDCEFSSVGKKSTKASVPRKRLKVVVERENEGEKSPKVHFPLVRSTKSTHKWCRSVRISADSLEDIGEESGERADDDSVDLFPSDLLSTKYEYVAEGKENCIGNVERGVQTRQRKRKRTATNGVKVVEDFQQNKSSKRRRAKPKRKTAVAAQATIFQYFKVKSEEHAQVI